MAIDAEPSWRVKAPPRVDIRDLGLGERLLILNAPMKMVIDDAEYWLFHIRRPQHRDEELLVPALRWRDAAIRRALRTNAFRVNGRYKVGQWGETRLLVPYLRDRTIL